LFFFHLFLFFIQKWGNSSFLGLTSGGKGVELRSRVRARQEIERKEGKRNENYRYRTRTYRSHRCWEHPASHPGEYPASYS
jgi:hypothetical protein